MANVEEDNSSTLNTPSSPVLPITIQYPTHHPIIQHSSIPTQGVGSGFIRVAIEQDRATSSSDTEIRRSWGWGFKKWLWIVLVNMFSIAQWFNSADTHNELQLTSDTPDCDPPRDVQQPTGVLGRIRQHLPVDMVNGTEEEEDEDTTNPPATPTPTPTPTEENLPESTATADEEEPAQMSPPTERIESANCRTQHELTSMIIDNLGSDSTILTRDVQRSSRVLGRISQNPLVVMLNDTEEDDTTYPPPTPIEVIVPITESMPESTSIGDEQGLAHNDLPIEFESHNDQNQRELTSPTMNVITRDPNILTRNEHNTRLHNYSDPKEFKFWLLLYASFCAPAVMTFFGRKHNSLAGPFLTISVALFVIAIITHIILSSMYERLNNPNSSYQTLSPDQYKILNYVCYTLCLLAYFLLLPVFLTSNINNDPSPPPQPSHPHYPHLHHH